MSHTRRDFAKLLTAATVAGGVPAWAAATSAPGSRSLVQGVQLGVQTYSYHEIPNDGANHIDAIIRDMQACGAYACELFAQQVAPGTLTGKPPSPDMCAQPLHGCAPGKGGTERNPFRWVFATYSGAELAAARAHQKQWNETVSMDFFRDVRKRMNDAGIAITNYNIMYPADASDLETDRFFEAAHTLGATSLNLSPKFTLVERLAPFADKHQIMLGIHGHSITWDSNEFSTMATFERAFALSRYIGANLDIGHYAATGEDPIGFIDKHHDRLTNLHLKDRKRNLPNTHIEDGASVPWGQGDTPIAQVLLHLKKTRYPIPAYIEYEHAGTLDPVGEVKKAYQYCVSVLEKA
jgi:sugar phosphate isomerase/epimerase